MTAHVEHHSTFGWQRYYYAVLISPLTPGNKSSVRRICPHHHRHRDTAQRCADAALKRGAFLSR